MQSSIQRTLWLKNRLAAMSRPEVAHRISEQIRRVVSRFMTPDFALDAAGNTTPRALPGLAENLPAIAGEKWLLHEWHEIAERARSGHLRLLGLEWPEERGRDRWHLDPVTGKHWPRADYCFSIPYRDAKDIGDVKYVWELNRLQYLQPIAALAVINKDAALARFCALEIESWIDNNPPFKGVNWASGIELAARLVSILVVISLIGDEAFTTEQRRKLQTTLANHGYWLMRFPSRFSSANNHLVAEVGALYLLGTLAPWLPQAARYADYGRDSLIDEIDKQIHPDGVGSEQSPTYTAFTLEWLLLCGKVAEYAGQPFPAHYWERIERAGEFLRWITDSSGNQPRIGDDDEGRVFYSQITPESYVSSVLGCLATVTGRQHLSPPMVRPHLREAFFGKTTTHSKSPSGIRCFEAGGYTVVRSTTQGVENLFVMDHGPVGYLSIAAHGHADALAVWLHVEGKSVLADAGTYLYHSGDQWRNRFRGTPAHNTLSIDGENSSRIAGAFNWSAKAQVSLLSFNDDPERWAVEAEHDGFLKTYGLRHRRRAEKRDGNTFLITDSLHGSGRERPIEIGFLFHPDLTVNRVNDRWVVRDKEEQQIMEIEYLDDSLTGAIEEKRQPSSGHWYSAAFGSKVPTCRLVFRGTAAAGFVFRLLFRITAARQTG